jgi:hypothetical protein
MRLLSMKKDATDRFVRDAIGCCHSAEGFFLIHHTLHDCGPVFSGNTVFRVFRPWSSVLEKRKVASLNEFIFCQKVLHLLIQYSCRVKEEIENW